MDSYLVGCTAFEEWYNDAGQRVTGIKIPVRIEEVGRKKIYYVQLPDGGEEDMRDRNGGDWFALFAPLQGLIFKGETDLTVSNHRRKVRDGRPPRQYMGDD